MENEKACEIKVEKTVKNLLMENDEMIYKIKYLVENIKNDIFGSDELKGDNPNPICMLQLLDIENYNLRIIIENLELITRTFKPNN